MDRNMRAEKRTISLRDPVRMLVESDIMKAKMLLQVMRMIRMNLKLKMNGMKTPTIAVVSKPESMSSTTSPRKITNYIYIRYQSIAVYRPTLSAGPAALKSANKVGPGNIPDSIGEDSKPSDFLSLLWTDDVWNLLVTETNRNAERVNIAKPNNYCAKDFVPDLLHQLRWKHSLLAEWPLMSYSPT